MQKFRVFSLSFLLFLIFKRKFLESALWVGNLDYMQDKASTVRINSTNNNRWKVWLTVDPSEPFSPWFPISPLTPFNPGCPALPIIPILPCKSEKKKLILKVYALNL